MRTKFSVWILMGFWVFPALSSAQVKLQIPVDPAKRVLKFKPVFIPKEQFEIAEPPYPIVIKELTLSEFGFKQGQMVTLSAQSRWPGR